MGDVKIKVIDSDKLVKAINEGSYDINLSAVMAIGAVMLDTKKQELCEHCHAPSAQLEQPEPCEGCKHTSVKIEPERKRGEWINHRNDNGHNIADCDQCGHAIQWFDGDETPMYCCICGSYNGGEQNG